MIAPTQNTQSDSHYEMLEGKRKLIDAQLYGDGTANGITMIPQQLDLMPVKPAHVPITPFTRFLSSPNFTKDERSFRLIEYRFYPDPLFIFAPANRSIRDTVHLFRHHWFAPLKTDEHFTVTHFALPIRIGNIPALFGKPPERCFANTEGFRIDCTQLRANDLDWIPVRGGKTQDGVKIPAWSVAWHTSFCLND